MSLKFHIVVSHPTGNANVRAFIEALFQEDMLLEFNTTMAVNPTASFLKLLPASMRNELLRRTYPVSSNKICTHPWLEFARMALPKIGLGKYVQPEHGYASIDAVYKNIDQATAGRLAVLNSNEKLSAVYAYEDGALATFKKAKELGLKCIYDLPIAYWETGRELMKEEAMRLPSWAPTLGGGISDSNEKLDRKSMELELSDMVIVPGEFVANSLPLWAKQKRIQIAPFGSPESGTGNLNSNGKLAVNDRPLRVLFVGSMGQRKGLGDLFNAMKLLNHPGVELVVMGSLLAPIDFYRNDYPGFIYEPGRPRHQVLELMSTCDVFCLPSIVEGRALVMQEAMSQGLPLIITENTGGADLIIEGETGFIVPIRSPEAIANKLSWFLDNRIEIPAMGRKAQIHAAKYSWRKYGVGIADSIKNLLT